MTSFYTTCAIVLTCLFVCRPKEVDPCEDVQCLNGGTCESIDEKTFKCTCLGDFTGKYCETRKWTKGIFLFDLHHCQYGLIKLTVALGFFPLGCGT